MGTLPHTIVDQIINVLEDNGLDPLSASERTGSMWFKEHQELVFKRQMPKGKIYFESIEPEDRSHGADFLQTKTIIVNCAFFTRKNDTDPTSGKKDRELVQYILDDVETKLKANSIASASLVGFGEVAGPIPYDEANNVFVGVKPVIYRFRE